MQKVWLMNSASTWFLTITLTLATSMQAAYAAEDPSYATRIARTSLIIDTHVDVPFRLYRNPADVGSFTEDGDFDYPRATAGGLDAPFMSIFIPASVDDAGGAYDLANELIDLMQALAEQHPRKFALASCVRDIESNFAKQLISLPLGMENGGPISSNFKNLEHFYKRGIRYITLAHSKPNHLSDSSYDRNRQWNGLSPFGRKLVPEMNKRGVMVDVSHISDEAFWQVIEVSQTPVIASHSSLRHFTEGFERNMSDAMVVALAQAGGVVQINFGSNFISQATQDYGRARTEALVKHTESNHLANDDPATRSFLTTYREAHPYPYATLDQVLDHIDRVVEITSIDAVGIGSDYDGVGDSLPVGLKNVSSYPNLVVGLLERGYSEEDIRKVLGGNLLRVWRTVEEFAEQHGNPPLCSQS